MMMSIFSSFDALSAEVFGQKVTSFWAPSTETKQQPKGVGPLVSDHKTGGGSPPSTSSTGGLKKDGEASPPSSSCQQQQKRQRFALELDGVHCFETIIPY
ncbi:PREDICTED: uncharacterized protein LOC109223886 [Nicotiana attenuata]|uniref:Uncharacterized protein n=1 Tax=Nicotiana attenuata TaxID=49451 RepID=A0A1J6ILE5_NICAT|nr:PREDICTED: uncharacterized protein LOC109223886 [Nicotiana attenuata]OIT05108.1 hypothetical protein A4A49_37762 [Nicotiana attenuata]